jgi:hypothetical protein
MATYLLTWNPTKTPQGISEQDIAEIRKKGFADHAYTRHFGPVCVVCDLDMAARYGNLGAAVLGLRICV